jgi:hypothetical protein
MSDQKVTTYYVPTPTTNKSTPKENEREPGETRAEQNRRIREQAPTREFVDRPDYKAPAKRKSAQKVKTSYDAPGDKEKRVAKRKAQVRELSSTVNDSVIGHTVRNIGHNVGGYVDTHSGQPPWVFGMKQSKPAFMVGPGPLPSWALGSVNPLAPATRGKRRNPVARPNGLPEWFRY